MTRTQRRSKSQVHNRMKRAGYKWWKGDWWKQWRFKPLFVCLTRMNYNNEEAT